MVSDHTSRVLEIRWKAGNGPSPRDDREAGSRTPAGSIDNMDTGINNN
jgi:hypothetical protein